MDEIEEAILDRTGFENIEASADLLNLKDEFNFIKNYFSQEWDYEPKDFQFKNGLYSIGNLRDIIIEEHTERITDSEQKIYNNYKKILDEFNNMMKEVGSVVDIDVYGKRDASSINLHRLINKLRDVRERTFY